ncbi:MAG: hypothetical protein A3A33_00660 [Candidatus Yanofskybacteria bacterium RIFCSPLOWO2_01_FULL_49_25]|uniref:Membrane insertase YidC/Oxa/ALB C-terminal domain-containing protein n=1 Tax=Candidatus Yanofskybacteria bacterium RIFCSPLOWO2_01_FULL_49_25 TaxID=1802701 RepID=A0A1F8GWY2_9BACT|nr:MAG: hypothetical protein A3A33_00660 [Candidatus Yanofskybacteria bacterium RIFCSPLOWO2_01_FULL_49_25]
MTYLFHEIFYRPLFNLLIGLYNHLPNHDLGLAIIVLTLIIRLIFFPLSVKAQVSQRKIAQLQPKLQELQAKHKGDKQKFAQESMALYKEYKVNPFSGCLPILIQLPVIFALYQVFIAGFKEGSLTELYPFVHNPGTIHTVSFGFLDLAHAMPVMAIIAGALQFAQAYNAMKLQSVPGAPENPALKMSRQMVYFFPIMIVFISWKLPAGLVLYWIVTTAFSLLEQLYIKRKFQ